MFATAAIAKDTIVWRHIPEQLTVYDEPRFQSALAGMSRAQAIYELNHCFGLADWPHLVIRVRDAGALINHDADPNLITRMHLLGPPPAGTGAHNTVAEVSAALLGDRYALIATRDIAAGEELTNDYTAEVSDPPFFDALYKRYGIEDEYL
ncbi:MAG: SET domain-containing protein-lysine N-methyltransferase [Roseovarius sp.]